MLAPYPNERPKPCIFRETHKELEANSPTTRILCSSNNLGCKMEPRAATLKSELSDEGAAQGANDPSCTITVFY